MAAPPREFSYEDVAKHNTKKDVYLVVHEKVYDCTEYIDEHPGGDEIIMELAGQDATESFEDAGHSDLAQEALADLFVGNLVKKSQNATEKTPDTWRKAKTSIVSAAIIVASSIVAFFAFQLSHGSPILPSS